MTLLTPGTRLGPYEITAAIGAGGMGEVFRARDTKLGRDVAIKVLPAALAEDAERVGRFRREAQILATLNHPNIAAIYGLEETGAQASGPPAFVGLVMELVAGEDLAERLRRGAIPIDEAIAMAIQIAEALEEAHEKGIVHRDLKPANVKVTPDRKVKVLDFGLAKALESAPSGSGAHDLSHSPTMSRHATEAGMIMGTAAYMSPEQARGKAVDKRGDIWAFGVVLYEMLTGERLFSGDTVSDVLAAVLTRDPNWATLPPSTPQRARDVLRRCLERNPKQRLHDIADARLSLQEAEAPVFLDASRPLASRPSVRARLGLVLAGAALTALGVAIFLPRLRTQPLRGMTRLSIMAPPGTSMYPDSAAVAISPDGTMVVFTVGDGSLIGSLWVRSLDSLAARRLEGTEGGTLPFWSPDSRRVGFFTQDKLMTVAVADGRAEALADAPGLGGRGGSWNSANVIVFAPAPMGPLYSVSGNGGEARPLTALDPGRGQSGHRAPAFLPDGDHFLYAALPAHAGKFDIFAGSLRDRTTTLIGAMETAPVYASPGFLLYGRQGVLAAQPFDVSALRTTGEAVSLDDAPVSVADPATSFTAAQIASVSAEGSLAYYSSPTVSTTATWIDVNGEITGTLPLPEGQYTALSISPDGTRAVLVRSRSASESSLWLTDLFRGGASPLSSGRGLNNDPVWSPDGSRVVFASDRDGPFDFYMKTVSDMSAEQPYYRSPVLFKNPDEWSADGRWIVFTSLDSEGAQNLWLLPTTGKPVPVPYVRGPQRDFIGRPSPDGRLLAYVSNETGRLELYTQAFPEARGKQQISTAGAIVHWWSRDSRDLYFVSAEGSSLWRAHMETGGTFRFMSPQRLATLPPNIIRMDAMPDRKRFLALISDTVGSGSATIVQSWRAALAKP